MKTPHTWTASLTQLCSIEMQYCYIEITGKLKYKLTKYFSSSYSIKDGE